MSWKFKVTPYFLTDDGRTLVGDIRVYDSWREARRYRRKIRKEYPFSEVFLSWHRR